MRLEGLLAASIPRSGRLEFTRDGVCPRVDVWPVASIAVSTAHEPKNDSAEPGPVALRDGPSEEAMTAQIGHSCQMLDGPGQGCSAAQKPRQRGRNVLLVAPTDDTENAHTGGHGSTDASRATADAASGSHCPL